MIFVSWLTGFAVIGVGLLVVFLLMPNKKGEGFDEIDQDKEFI